MFGLKKPEGIKSPEKIGVYIGVPGLGDFLFIIPLFRALKSKWPDAETVFIGDIQRKYILPLLETTPHIDREMKCSFYEDVSLRGNYEFVKKIKSEKFDLIIDTQRKLMPSFLLSLSGSPVMVSYCANGVFSDIKVDVPNKKRRHTSDVSLDLARALGISNPSTELEITLTKSNTDSADSFFKSKEITSSQKIAGIIPNAGYHTRRWNSQLFAQLAERLNNELGMTPLLLGSIHDKPVIDEIVSYCEVNVLVEDFENKSILDSAALMSKCAVIIGVDSGPLHVADATGVPCVGIYGPTFPERFGLLGPKTAHVCLYQDCAPCKNLECDHRKCIESITVEQVFNVVCDVIK